MRFTTGLDFWDVPYLSSFQSSVVSMMLFHVEKRLIARHLASHSFYGSRSRHRISSLKDT